MGILLIYAYVKLLYVCVNVLCCGAHSLSLLKVCRPRFEPRAALANCYRISSCKQFLTMWNAYFWLDCCIFFFCMEKKKRKVPKPSWQHCRAVTASCEVLLLRTLTVKHVAAFLKSSYLWLHNYSLDVPLLFNRNLELHLNLQITYTDHVQEKHGVWYLVNYMREKLNLFIRIRRWLMCTFIFLQCKDKNWYHIHIYKLQPAAS